MYLLRKRNISRNERKNEEKKKKDIKKENRWYIPRM
jgi:hypothetical protein